MANVPLHTVPPPEVLEYFKRCIQHIDDSDTLIIDVDAVQTSPRDATTSYVVQANFKPAEVIVNLSQYISHLVYDHICSLCLNYSCFMFFFPSLHVYVLVKYFSPSIFALAR